MGIDPKEDTPFMFDVESEEILEKEIQEIPPEAIKDLKFFKNLYNALTKRSVGIFILKLLQRKARYGYEIESALQEEFSVKTSQISTYKALYKLNEEGLVTCRILEPMGSVRTRKYYFITPMGMKMLKEAKKFITQVLYKI